MFLLFIDLIEAERRVLLTLSLAFPVYFYILIRLAQVYKSFSAAKSVIHDLILGEGLVWCESGLSGEGQGPDTSY